jgi:hypothetical protein
MDTVHQEEPTLVFFRDRPANLVARPPLASSLQHLETSFLLTAIGRYPHALIACASAIESAIKAAVNASESDRFRSFEELTRVALRKFPNFDVLRQDTTDFRYKRNDFIHFGFSPKDGALSARLLLETGYPHLERCYQEFFQFHLYDALIVEVAHHLRVACRVYDKAKPQIDLDLSYCFISFAHQIRMGTQHWTMSDWRIDLLDSAEQGGAGEWPVFEFKMNQKEAISHKFDAYWEFDCPVCGEPDAFVCELDCDELNEGKISVIRGVCVHCNLVIPRNCPFIANELCAKQLDEARPRILKEYGIA